MSQWLAALEAALGANDSDAIAALFQPDGHWRDLVAFTWHISPFIGSDKIAAAMVAAQKSVNARGFRVSANRTPPRRTRRLGIDVIEAIIEFETDAGRGNGVVRLVPDDAAGTGDAAKAWILADRVG